MAYHWSSDFIPKLLPQSIIDKLPLSEADYGLTTPQGAPHEYVTARNTSTGEVMKKIPLRGGRRVSRKRFRLVLSEGIDIKYDKTVENITYLTSGVGVSFTDGTKALGSIVVGADGGGSRIRRLLLGNKAEPTALPIIMNNFNVQYTAEQALFIRSKLAPFTDLGVHPKGMFYLMNLQNVPRPEDPSTWSFQMSTSWPVTLRPLAEEENTSEGRLKILKELTADHAEPRKSAMAWVPADYPVSKDRLAIWSPIPWDHHNGRVTMAGDAAHAMTYHRGQGLNNCINDAANLVTGLVEVKDGARSLSEFIDEYQVEVVTRGAAEVEMSKQQSLMIHHWDQFIESPVMTYGTAGINELKEKKSKAARGGSVL
ncbi:hypothetical protein BP5796_12786 [Coleophoma crateriformis]|uniref:FAD-binding domain-containing protein n=1 Tax=Coleophoma crateriformis TaxID=565419 RepID=A0A3D8Q690_9HELO|nr:hypothetical protein BP5796_12786 [Coleophoma crateriformis]